MTHLRTVFLALLVIPAVVAAQPAAPASAVAKPSKSRSEIKAKARDLAVAVEAAEAALSPGELAIAERVHLGTLPCELGAVVTIAADTRAPGYFDVQLQKAKYRMFPVETTTGAIRLEDRKAGAVWLQLGNKSMLMNHKLGKRLADECMSPAQAAVAQALKNNPQPSILEAVKP